MDPGSSHHFLLPGFVDAQVRRVDEAAHDQVREILAEIIEGHPAGGGERRDQREGRRLREEELHTGLKTEEMKSGTKKRGRR